MQKTISFTSIPSNMSRKCVWILMYTSFAPFPCEFFLWINSKKLTKNKHVDQLRWNQDATKMSIRDTSIARWEDYKIQNVNLIFKCVCYSSLFTKLWNYITLSKTYFLQCLRFHCGPFLFYVKAFLCI